jgi:hypothetical protein
MFVSQDRRANVSTFVTFLFLFLFPMHSTIWLFLLMKYILQ